MTSSSPLCLALADLHTAFGFTQHLQGEKFIEQNLIPWISKKDVAMTDNFLGSGTSFR